MKRTAIPLLLLLGSGLGLNGRPLGYQEPAFDQKQAPTVHRKTHDLSNIHLTVTNYGHFGGGYPACQFPAGSNTEYLYWGGFWIGAITGDNDTCVSVGCEGWSGWQYELFASSDPGDTIRERSVYSGDPDAVSGLDFICTYSDTWTFPQYVGLSHRPLGIAVDQRSYSWVDEWGEDLIMFDCVVRNVQAESLRNVYVGLYIDGDCGPSDESCSEMALDDVTGFRRCTGTTCDDTVWNPKELIETAWLADASGEQLYGYGSCLGAPAPCVTGIRPLDAPNPMAKVSYNWWISDSDKTEDWGPFDLSNPNDSLFQQLYLRQHGDSLPGTPDTDREKYLLLSNGAVDPDQLAEPPGGRVHEPWDDTRYLLSWGPLSTRPDSSFLPGDSIRFAFAWIGGEDFHRTLGERPRGLTSSEDWYDFGDIGRNALHALDVHDNTNYDTDGDGWAGEAVVDPASGDTIDWTGDGVPDFRVPPQSPPARPRELRVAGRDETKVSLEWRGSLSLDAAGYHVYRSTVSGSSYVLLDSVSLSDTAYTDTSGLDYGLRYYWITVCIDSLGLESDASNEVSAIFGQPEPPPRVSASSGRNGRVDVSWVPAPDGDVVFYNVYRRVDDESLPVPMDSQITVRWYKDVSVTNGHVYSYGITAVDSFGIESELSEEGWGIPMAFDGDILLVDETDDSRVFGSDDSTIDRFYHDLLTGYTWSDWENSRGTNSPTLPDLSPHPVVVYHTDEMRCRLDTELLKKYLHAGGRLWLTGGGLLDHIRLLDGSFLSEYLHMSEWKIQRDKDFEGAKGLEGFPPLEPDTCKLYRPWFPEGLLSHVGVFALDEGEPIYAFNSASGDTCFDGQPCAFRYLGEDYRVVFMDFPLYWMKGDLELMAEMILHDLTSSEDVEARPIPSDHVLLQNYPNPFALSTTVRYGIREESYVILKVFNVAGQFVKTLVDGPKEPGFWTVDWDGTDARLREVSSGVYFLRLAVFSNRNGRPAGELGGRAMTKKLVLVR